MSSVPRPTTSPSSRRNPRPNPASGVIAAAVLAAWTLLSGGPVAVEAQGVDGSSTTSRGSVGSTFFGGGSGDGGSRVGGGSRVPINVNTIANGTANQPLPPETKRPSRHRFRGGVVWWGYPRIYDTRSRATAPRGEHVSDPDTGEEGRRGSGRLPRIPEGRFGDGAETTPAAPLIEPPRGSSGRGTEVDLERCALLRVSTEGGIEWRQRVSLDDLGVDSPDEAAALFHDVLGRGDPLEVAGPDGSFRVPAALVDAVIVGPC